jgi:hypothetical protein
MHLRRKWQNSAVFDVSPASLPSLTNIRKKHYHIVFNTYYFGDLSGLGALIWLG